MGEIFMSNGNDHWTHWPWSVKSMPILINDLIAKKVRIIYPEDKITEEYESGRVTIHIAEDHRIYDIKIEPYINQNLMSLGEKVIGDGPGDGPILPWPTLKLSNESGLILIKQLLGRKVRIVYPEDKITEEYQSGRVTIFINKEHLIDNIHIESTDGLTG